MGTVTILNNTNTTINSCISAGVNYSWVNKLSPKQFYVHNGAWGVYTLSNKYWLGEASEFTNSGAEIGLWVAGIVVGVIGLVAIPFTGGGSLGASAAIITAIGGVTGGVGMAISGISIAVKDFTNAPSTWTNIHAIKNRKFVAEGNVVATVGKDGTLVYSEVPAITFREINETEFQTMIKEGGFVGYQADPENAAQLPKSYVGKDDADLAKLLDKPLRLYPSLGGDACWEVEGDQTSDGAPMQLWSRNEDKVRWYIEPVADVKLGDVFALHNRKLDRYATCRPDPSHRVTSAKQQAGDATQLFKIGKSGKYWVFFPASDSTLALVPEDGNQGNSTKLVVAPTIGPDPGFARWRVDVG